MEDKNCDLLFEYLRSILYNSNVQTLDISTLGEFSEAFNTMTAQLKKNTKRCIASYKTERLPFRVRHCGKGDVLFFISEERREHQAAAQRPISRSRRQRPPMVRIVRLPI